MQQQAQYLGIIVDVRPSMSRYVMWACGRPRRRGGGAVGLGDSAPGGRDFDGDNLAARKPEMNGASFVGNVSDMICYAGAETHMV
jgi:hypothetical protein